MFTLPDGTKRSLQQILMLIDTYREQYPAVFDLYDLPGICGPHDELLPIDLLSLNAMNAWAGGQPMTWMTEAWKRRNDIANIVKPVSRMPMPAKIAPTEAAASAARCTKTLRCPRSSSRPRASSQAVPTFTANATTAVPATI